MEQIYIVILVALAVLATIDLMVGVANDAVNFLNSGIGSKAVSFRTIMIIASIGVALGAFFSSGMMEIARSGIFNPGMFTFNDVMVIFFAVMVTDIILLDVFNSLGLPTSTTVSIVFSLLGGAVFAAFFKVIMADGELGSVFDYINSKKATEIVVSILLSVALSFTVGALVQYISRLIFTFHTEKRLKYFGAIFGGIGITAITYFILFKGLKSSSFMTDDIKLMMKENQGLIILCLFVFWLVFSQIFIALKINIFKVIILIGTFALALAFAGNDLVNFIGVPIAALQSYDIYVANGFNAQMLMGELASTELKANFWLLFLGGAIMVYTLWTSKKSREVIKTGVDLSRQSEGSERFDANNLSRAIVRFFMYIGIGINYILPKKLQLKIDAQFVKNDVRYPKGQEPAFDMVRASVNLMVASILIAIGTSLKLPLSTTYVTFMVAMGTSFADRAWDRESAVYRVAGVFNVIGGWFFTAFVAFSLSGILVTVLIFGKVFAFIGLMILIAIILYRSAKSYTKKSKELEIEKESLNLSDILTIKEIVSTTSSQIAKVVRKSKILFSEVIHNLGTQDLSKLKENKKTLKKLEKEVDSLKNNVHYFIKNLDETSVPASQFYIVILGYLQDISQSIGFITNLSFTHINNNHKNLKYNQIKDLKTIDNQISDLFGQLELIFSNEDFQQLPSVLNQKLALFDSVSLLIQNQIVRIRTSENSPKNSKLYFGLLLETNDLVKATMNLLELFDDFAKKNNN